MQTAESTRRRIGTTESLFSVVKTMKALSAVSIRQCEDAVRSLVEYQKTIELGLQVVLKQFSPRTDRRLAGPERTAVVVMGSDHGLCGRFNEEIGDFALRTLRERHVDSADRVILPVGARIAEQLEHSGQELVESLPAVGSITAIAERVQEVLWRVDEWRAQQVDQVWLVHHRFFPGSRLRPQLEILWPLDLERIRAASETGWPPRSLPIFTMDPTDLLRALIRRQLFATLFRAFADAAASEHASRLATMQAAERNIDEHLQDLRTEFARTRQDAITSELLDIVSGFEVLTTDSR